MQRPLSLLVALAGLEGLACGPSTSSVAPSSATAPPASAASSVSPEPPLSLPEGECGGFAALPLGEPAALLRGRLWIRSVRGADDLPRATNIMAAPAMSDAETRIFYEDEQGRKLVIWTRELYATADDGLLREVRAAHEGSPVAVESIELEGFSDAVRVTPRELTADEEAVHLATLFTRTRDGLVQSTGFYVNPIASTGGCRRFAHRLMGSVEQGDRASVVSGRRVSLGPSLSVDLPEGWTAQIEQGPDFSVFRLHPLRGLSADPSWLGIYVGQHPSFEAEGSPVRGELLGTEVEWYDSVADGTHRREGLARAPGVGTLHVFMGGPDRSDVEAATRVVSSLEAAPAPAAWSCRTTTPVEPVRAPGLANDPRVTLLAEAEELSVLGESFTGNVAERTAAFRGLTSHRHAPRVFAHLVAVGTDAGKIYGLAGLSAVGARSFPGIFCAVKPRMQARVEVTGICGTTATDVGSLLENEDAVRGEPFWQAGQWRAALGEQSADVRGGGLGRQILYGPDYDTRRAETAVRMLDGVRWPTDPRDFAPDRRAAHLILGMSQACTTRRDGRWACWSSREEWLYPDHIRFPAAVAGTYSPCFADREGRVTCFGGALDRALAVRAAECGNDAVPDHVAFRELEGDGWTLHDLDLNVCVSRGGGLWCVSGERNPHWAPEPEQPGFAGLWRVPVDGQVVGASDGHATDGWAWTEDGEIWTWDSHDPPHRVGRLEGVVRVTAAGRNALAELADGRVFALGPERVERWWDSYGRGQSWIEIPPLRDSHIVATSNHFCALGGDQRVRCWGSPSGRAFAVESDEFRLPPTEVPVLRGARELFLAQHATCGLMRGDLLRCVGDGARHLGAANARGVREVRLRRRAAEIR